MLVRALLEAERSWAAALVAEHFGSSSLVSRGVLHDSRWLPALGAGEHLGLLHYCVDGDELEVVVACHPRRGVGWRLLEAAEKLPERGDADGSVGHDQQQSARARAYRAVGWRQSAIHLGAVREARRLKPQIPLTGHVGLPIEDEIEFECLIDPQPHVTD